MIIDRVYTPGLAQVAYLVADEAAGEAAVIDPRRDIGAYTDWAAARGFRIVAILETHVHADFVSGAQELAAATGATVYAGRIGGTAYPHVALDDGDEIRVGGLTLRAFWTPGHTPEHMSYLLFDPARGPDPVALFSGDVLFVGEIGRPDLLGTGELESLAEQLHETVGFRLAALPDAVTVYPGHTAGSPCGKKIGDAPTTTIGQERLANYAFQPGVVASAARFAETVMAGMPQPPAYYPTMKRVNKLGPAPLADLPAGEPLSPTEVADRQAAGALVLDTRGPEAFAAGHVPGSVFAGLGPSFAIWAGWLTPYGRDVVLVTDGPEPYAAARADLWRIGVDRVVGYLDGGVAAWQAAGRPLATVATMAVGDLARELGRPDSDVAVLDVRDRSEWEQERAPGAAHWFAGEIAQGRLPVLPVGKRVALLCGSGYRSMVAASLLQAAGATDVVNVLGGIGAWEAAGLPVERHEAARA